MQKELRERRANVSAIERKRERGVAAMGSSPAAICSKVCELGVEWM